MQKLQFLNFNQNKIMSNLNNIEIEHQELSDDQLETVVGGTFKISRGYGGNGCGCNSYGGQGYYGGGYR
jgi:hypothetical protein